MTANASDAYAQPKRALSGGFNTVLALDTAATSQVVIVVKKTTPLYEPHKHIIHVQRLTVEVITGSAKTWTFRSSVTHTNITPALSMATAGTLYEFDFGPQGRAIDINEDLSVLISAAGAAANVTIEGFQEYTSTVLPLTFSLNTATADVHASTNLTLTAAAGTFFFAGTVAIHVNGVACTSPVRVSSSSITCVLPAPGTGGDGTFDVVLTQSDGTTVTLTDGFIFTEDAYVIDSVTPSDGDRHLPLVNVTLAGYYFGAGVSVTFDGVPATNIVIAGDHLSLTCDVPVSATAGMVDVTFLNTDLTTATLVDGYEYTEEAYAITDVNPATGAAAGGTPVTLTGYYFGAGVGVTFDGVPATSVVPAADGLTCTCVTPAHAAGAVDVVYLNTDTTTATAAAGYLYT